MKKLLIISFDLIRDGEPEVSFSVASILASLKSDAYYRKKFDYKHVSINLLQIERIEAEDIFEEVNTQIIFSEYDFIALSAYVWSESFLNEFIRLIKLKHNDVKIILGGNQITNDVQLEKLYPQCDIFILGYAEGTLQNAILNDYSYPVKLTYNYDEHYLKSPYLTKIITGENEYSNIRVETKRGCLYNCDYCAHIDIHNKGIIKHNEIRIKEEIKLLKSIKSKKINIIDPIYTCCNDYIGYLEEYNNNEIDSQIKVQARFDLFNSSKSIRLLSVLKSLNIHIELGVQTIFEKEAKAIGRKTSQKVIKNGVEELLKNNISFEVSVIYGLPFQTLNSFKTLIEFLKDIGCNNIKAYPLMLLRGTQLFHNKNKYDITESKIGILSMPYVTESISFSKKEWVQMSDYVNLKLNQNAINI